MSSTFNISAKSIISEDTLVRDTFVNTTGGTCSYKLRTCTAKVPVWIETLKLYYNAREEFSLRANEANDKTVLRIRRVSSSARKQALTITVFSTGSVTIQGDKGELEDFVGRFEEIKKSCSSCLAETRSTPARQENSLLDAAEVTLDLSSILQPVEPTPSGASHETPGPSHAPDPVVATGETPKCTPEQRPTPAPRKRPTPAFPQPDDRMRVFESELIEMDKRMTSHFDQFRLLVIYAVNE